MIKTHAVMLCLGVCAVASASAQTASMDAEGRMHIPDMNVPLSAYMSPEAKQAFIKRTHKAPDADRQPTLSLQQQREAIDRSFRPLLERAEALYPVNIVSQSLAGVHVDIIEPKGGVSPAHRSRILINLHGGSFRYATGGGARLIEGVPIAGMDRIKVVSVDYRMSPQSHFPAAVDDAIGVYKELLKTYRPQNIGIYGCSTGAALTGNLIARIARDKLPVPGAIGLFCEGAIKDDQLAGDSYYVGAALTGMEVPERDAQGDNPYLDGTSATDPLVAPVVSLKTLAAFPPTLLLSGTRDFCLSTVLYTHARLVKAGVVADLHVWDGMWHGFFFDVDLPESKEAYAVIMRFFDLHLGQGA